MLGVIWIIGMVMWMGGMWVTMLNTTKDVHSSFKMMWGYRLESLGVLVVMCLHIKVNLGDWVMFNTLYVILMTIIFIGNAYNEYYTRGIFTKQVNKMK